MNLTEAFATPNLVKHEEVFFELVKGCTRNFQRSINSAYRKGMAKPCVSPIWEQVGIKLKEAATKRTIHGRLNETADMTQEQWADELQVAQGTICKWLQNGVGSTDLGNLLLAMTCFGIEEIPLPKREDRVVYGYVEALNVTRTKELKLPRLEATPAVVYSISELYRSQNGWVRATEKKGQPEYERALAEAADAVRKAANHAAGRELGFRTPKDYMDLQRDWGRSWMIVIKCSPVVITRVAAKAEGKDE